MRTTVITCDWCGVQQDNYPHVPEKRCESVMLPCEPYKADLCGLCRQALAEAIRDLIENRRP